MQRISALSMPRPIHGRCSPDILFTNRKPQPPLGHGSPLPARDAVLARAYWLSASAAEAEVLSGAKDPQIAATQLAAGRDGALVRIGAGGCWLATAEGSLHVPGFKVRAIDSNGAGDTHVGAFIASLMAGHSPRDAAIHANAAAALSTTRIGPATAPDLEETRRLLDRNGISLGRPAGRQAARV